MCGRFYVSKEMAEAIENLIRQVDERFSREQFGRDIHPSEEAAVLARGQNSLNVRWQKWGFPGYQGNGLIFNARAETALEKRMFRDSVMHRRIVVPAAWFYEWNPAKEKVAFSGKDAPVLFMAGFSKAYEEDEHFVILTTAANESMAGVHDRMPLILERETLESWVFDDSKTEEILAGKPPLLEKKSEYEQISLKF